MIDWGESAVSDGMPRFREPLRLWSSLGGATTIAARGDASPRMSFSMTIQVTLTDSGISHSARSPDFKLQTTATRPSDRGTTPSGEGSSHFRTLGRRAIAAGMMMLDRAGRCYPR